MSEHTKTPWGVELGEEVYICSEETQCDVTTVVNFDRTKENEANARYIVHCVNNHEKLVALIKRIEKDVAETGKVGQETMCNVDGLLCELEAGGGGQR